MPTLVRKSTKIGCEDDVGVKNRRAEFPKRDSYSILILTRGCFKVKKQNKTNKSRARVKIPIKKPEHKMYSKSFQILTEHTLKTEIISVKMVIKLKVFSF